MIAALIILIAQVTLPDLALYRSNAQTYALKACATLKDPTVSFDTKLAGTYYDAINVYYSLADYFVDPSLNSCALAARSTYRENYVDGPSPAGCNHGFCPGYESFTDGLVEDYIRTGDAKSKNAVIELATNAAFARDNTAEDTSLAMYSREVAYAILSYLNAERVGAPRRARLTKLIDQAFGHLEQYSNGTAPVKPFFIALTALSLIRWNEVNPDARLVPALKKVADKMWATCWNETSQSMLYIEKVVPGEDPPSPAPDLNLLIVPMYGFLYWQTGDAKYLTEGDKLFSGGVRNGFLGNGKQFDQAYRWSLKYLEWRSAAKSSPTLTCNCQCGVL